MKLAKTSAIAFAISALLAGPVLAQGAPSDTQIRGGAQGKTNNMKGGAVRQRRRGNGCADGRARRPSPANAKSGTKGTVGAGSGAAPKGSSGATGDPAAGGKRY